MITVLPEPSKINSLLYGDEYMQWIFASLVSATREEALQFFYDHKINLSYTSPTMGWTIDTRSGDPVGQLLSTVATFIPVVGPLYGLLRRAIQPNQFVPGADAAVLSGPRPTTQTDALNQIKTVLSTKEVQLSVAGIIFLWILIKIFR